MKALLWPFVLLQMWGGVRTERLINKVSHVAFDYDGTVTAIDSTELLMFLASEFTTCIEDDAKYNKTIEGESLSDMNQSILGNDRTRVKSKASVEIEKTLEELLDQTPRVKNVCTTPTSAVPLPSLKLVDCIFPTQRRELWEEALRIYSVQYELHKATRETFRGEAKRNPKRREELLFHECADSVISSLYSSEYLSSKRVLRGIALDQVGDLLPRVCHTKKELCEFKPNALKVTRNLIREGYKNSNLHVEMLTRNWSQEVIRALYLYNAKNESTTHAGGVHMLEQKEIFGKQLKIVGAVGLVVKNVQENDLNQCTSEFGISKGLTGGVTTGEIIEYFSTDSRLASECMYNDDDLHSQFKRTQCQKKPLILIGAIAKLERLQLFNRTDADSSRLTVYIGDSSDDVLALREADLGIAINVSTSGLKTMCDAYDIPVLCLKENSDEIKKGNLKRDSIYVADNWDDIEDVLFNP